MKRIALSLAALVSLTAAAELRETIIVSAPYSYIEGVLQPRCQTVYGNHDPDPKSTLGPLSNNYVSSGNGLTPKMDVAVTARPPKGMQPVEWRILSPIATPSAMLVSNTTTIASYPSTGNDFVLRWEAYFASRDVREFLLTPCYEKIPSVFLHGNGDGAEVPVKSVEARLGAPYGMPDATRPGYDFVGWYTNPTGGSMISADQTVTDLAKTNLYARWKAKTFSLFTASSGDGSGSLAPAEGEGHPCTYGSTVTLHAYPDEGSLFTGWQDGDTNRVRTVTVSGDATYTATFMRRRYDIVFRYRAENGGATQTVVRVAHGDSAVPPPDSAVNGWTGHTFLGWTGAEYDNVERGGDVIAEYILNTYSIRFDANGGSGSIPAVSEVAYGADVSLPAAEAILSRTGYVFVGWATTPDAEAAEYAEGGQVRNLTTSHNVTVTLYAVWKPNSYKVRFDANGGVGTMQDVGLVYDTPAFLPKCAFSRGALEFEGWSRVRDAASVYIDEDVVKNLATNQDDVVTLYAAWKGGYTVTFHDPLVSAEDYSQPFELTVEQRLVPVRFAPPGQKFQGWATSDGGEKAYDDCALVTKLGALGETVDLYAVWSDAATTYTIRFDPNGGAGEMKSVWESSELTSGPMGGSFSLPPNAYVGPGAFLGWALSPEGDVVYEDGEEVSGALAQPGEIVTLYAKWGAPAVSPIAVAGDCLLALTAENRPGSTTPPVVSVDTEVAGAVGGSAIRIDAPDGMDLYSDVKIKGKIDGPGMLTFKWMASRELVPDNGRGATFQYEPYDTVSGLPQWPTNRVPSVGAFSEVQVWIDQPGRSIQWVAAYPPFEDGSPSGYTYWIDDIRWLPEDYWIIFHANGSSVTGTTADQQASQSQTNVLNECAFRDGGNRQFLGWSLTPDGDVRYDDRARLFNVPSDAFNALGNLDLYAQWSDGTWLLSFVTDGGSWNEGLGDKSVDVGRSVKLPAADSNPSRPGYRFLGWSKTLGAATPDYQPGETITLDAKAGEKVYLYAVWARGYTVRFHLGRPEATGEMAPMELQFGKDATNITACAFTCLDCEFMGWATELGGEVVYADGAAVADYELGGTAGRNVVLYAVWREWTFVDAPRVATDLVYTGESQTGVEANPGSAATGDFAATDVGSYEAVVSLDEGCAWSSSRGTGTADVAPKTVNWTIARATYDLSGVSFASASFEADGSPKSIFVTGALPKGVTVTYKGNGQTAVGTYTVTATFAGDMKNYEPVSPASLTATLTVVASGKDDPGEDDPGEDDPGEDDPGEDDPDDEPPVLHPTPVLGAFTAEKAATYVGWLRNDDGSLYATLSVKAGAARTGRDSKVTVTVTPVGGKRKNVKTVVTPGGNPKDANGIVFGSLGLTGVFEGHVVEAAQDFSKAKLAEHKAMLAKVPVGTHALAAMTPSGLAALSVTVSNKGKAKISGTVAGKKLSLSTVGALGEKMFAVPVVYAKRGLSVAFVLWIPLDGSGPKITGLSADWTLAALGEAKPLADGEHFFTMETPPFRDYLETVDGAYVSPAGEPFSVTGAKWAVPKTAGKLKYDREAARPVVVLKNGEYVNLAALKLKYTAKSGAVSGSFYLYHLLNGALKKDKVTVGGIVVDGRFYGSGTIKKLGVFEVGAQ